MVLFLAVHISVQAIPEMKFWRQQQCTFRRELANHYYFKQQNMQLTANSVTSKGLNLSTEWVGSC